MDKITNIRFLLLVGSIACFSSIFIFSTSRQNLNSMNTLGGNLGMGILGAACVVSLVMSFTKRSDYE